MTYDLEIKGYKPSFNELGVRDLQKLCLTSDLP